MDIEITEDYEMNDEKRRNSILMTMNGDNVHVEMYDCALYGGSVEWDAQSVVMQIPFEKLKEFVDHHRDDPC